MIRFLLVTFAVLIACPGRAAEAGAEAAPAVAPDESPGTRERVLLQSGRPVREELGPGQVRGYRFPLASGEYAHIVVERRGIELEAVLLDGTGRVLAEDSRMTGSWSDLEMSWIADAPGDYLLDLCGPTVDAIPGELQVLVSETRPERTGDRTRLRAEELSARAYRFVQSEDDSSKKRAKVLFEEALPLWREIGDRRGEASALYGIGRALHVVGERSKAIEPYSAGLAVWREVGDRSQIALNLRDLAMVESTAGKLREAQEHLGESLSVAREIGDGRAEGRALAGQGYAYDISGEKQKAIEAYAAALPVLRSVQARSAEQTTLNNLGFVYDQIGDRQKAIDAYRQSFDLAWLLQDRLSEAITLGNIGGIYLNLGEYERALELFGEALAITRSINNRDWESVTLLKIGLALSRKGEHELAIENFVQAIPIFEEEQDAATEGVAVNYMGEAHLAIGRPSEALADFESAIALARTSGERQIEGMAMTNLGLARAGVGDRSQALADLQCALEFRRGIGNLAGEATTMFQIARLERESGDLEAARTHVEASLALLESLRARLASQKLRASYLASVRKPYEFYVDLLTELHRREPSAGFDVRALQASERERVQGLRELLAESRLELRQGVDPSLLEKERSLGRTLGGKIDWRIRLEGASHSAEQLKAADREIETLTEQYDRVDAEIRAANPRYAALAQPETLGIQQMREEVLGGDAMLLEYAQGEERSHLFAVTSDSLNIYELPGRAELEEASRRVYGLLTERNRHFAAEDRQTREDRIARAETAYREASLALSRTLLGPVAGELGTRRLLLVADGALQYLPFAALPSPVDGHSDIPLGWEREIVGLPSAGVLAELRKEIAGRPSPPRTVAVLADPVFDRRDKRVRAPTGKPVPVATNAARIESDGPLERSARSFGEEQSGELRIPRLPFTRREAIAIATLAPADRRKEALDFAANLALAKSSELAQYRFVHFATHGFLNTRNPDLSGLVFSLVDEQGKDQEGFLSSPEVYGLKLPVDLVVLSACRTGLGEEVRGEGLVGLTRGFMYAGAARVLVSLWDVDDAATAALMARFYEGMIGSEHLTASAALRSAQISMSKEKRWQSPYYWAAFILQGEPN
jgi:CHAT domain-containing protein/Tfp pilus assembly protein PilF